jgi:hypothetical protein
MDAADILPDFRGRAVHDFWDNADSRIMPRGQRYRRYYGGFRRF